MSWVAVGATAVGVGGSIIGGMASADAQEDQAAQQAAIAAENLRYQRERDAQVQEQFQTQQSNMAGGRLDEIVAGAGQTLDATMFDANAVLAQAQQFQPTANLSLAQGAGTLADIFGGQAEADDLALLRRNADQRLQAFNPVADARLGGVTAGRQAIEEGFQKALATNDARRAAAGGGVTSTFDRNQMAQQFLAANQQQAQLQSNVELANANDIRSLQEQRLSGELAMPERFRNQRVQLLNEPLNQLNRQTQALISPNQQIAEGFGGVVRGATGNLPILAPPNVQALNNSFQPQSMINSGQILGAGLGAASQGISNIGNAMQMNNLIDSFNPPPPTTTPAATTMPVGGSPNAITVTSHPAGTSVQQHTGSVIPPMTAPRYENL